ncbi:unnamed protein product [Xylocopa violacea]|uniref:Uncharacterized protein n=1 Tax=Xylocopa violacea TaxID=135666 RepID=A0ABP1P3Q7_XYLVO
MFEDATAIRNERKTILLAICCALLLSLVASNISEECEISETTTTTTTINCRCTSNEVNNRSAIRFDGTQRSSNLRLCLQEFSLPEGYNYENVTNLRIASCSFANLHFSSLTEANRITEIVVQNISERLIFELFLASRRMKRVKLSKIRSVPSITRDTFLGLNSIESFEIEDTRIDSFEERFTDVAIRRFSMINVTIERIDELNFSGKGETLRIENSRFENVHGSLNFAYFSTVEIVRSNFQLQKPGLVLIEGDVVYMEDCMFSNSSANVVAADSIKISGTCAAGKSSMRLSSNNIESLNNRLPTEIVYTTNKLRATERFFNRNNTVCIAGNCNCPKSNGQPKRFKDAFPANVLRFLLPIAILLSTC